MCWKTYEFENNRLVIGVYNNKRRIIEGDVVRIWGSLFQVKFWYGCVVLQNLEDEDWRLFVSPPFFEDVTFVKRDPSYQPTHWNLPLCVKSCQSIKIVSVAAYRGEPALLPLCIDKHGDVVWDGSVVLVNARRYVARWKDYQLVLEGIDDAPMVNSFRIDLEGEVVGHIDADVKLEYKVPREEWYKWTWPKVSELRV